MLQQFTSNIYSKYRAAKKYFSINFWHAIIFQDNLLIVSIIYGRIAAHKERGRNE